jgi:hypothetical protein
LQYPTLMCNPQAVESDSHPQSTKRLDAEAWTEHYAASFGLASAIVRNAGWAVTVAAMNLPSAYDHQNLAQIN